MESDLGGPPKKKNDVNNNKNDASTSGGGSLSLETITSTSTSSQTEIPRNIPLSENERRQVFNEMARTVIIGDQESVALPTEEHNRLMEEREQLIRERDQLREEREQDRTTIERIEKENEALKILNDIERANNTLKDIVIQFKDATESLNDATIFFSTVKNEHLPKAERNKEEAEEALDQASNKVVNTTEWYQGRDIAEENKIEARNAIKVSKKHRDAALNNEEEAREIQKDPFEAISKREDIDPAILKKWQEATETLGNTADIYKKVAEKWEEIINLQGTIARFWTEALTTWKDALVKSGLIKEVPSDSDIADHVSLFNKKWRESTENNTLRNTQEKIKYRLSEKHNQKERELSQEQKKELDSIFKIHPRRRDVIRRHRKVREDMEAEHKKEKKELKALQDHEKEHEREKFYNKIKDKYPDYNYKDIFKKPTEKTPKIFGNIDVESLKKKYGSSELEAPQDKKISVESLLSKQKSEDFKDLFESIKLMKTEEGPETYTLRDFYRSAYHARIIEGKSSMPYAFLHRDVIHNRLELYFTDKPEFTTYASTKDFFLVGREETVGVRLVLEEQQGPVKQASRESSIHESSETDSYEYKSEKEIVEEKMEALKERIGKLSRDITAEKDTNIYDSEGRPIPEAFKKVNEKLLKKFEAQKVRDERKLEGLSKRYEEILEDEKPFYKKLGEKFGKWTKEFLEEQPYEFPKLYEQFDFQESRELLKREMELAIREKLQESEGYNWITKIKHEKEKLEQRWGEVGQENIPEELLTLLEPNRAAAAKIFLGMEDKSDETQQRIIRAMIMDEAFYEKVKKSGENWKQRLDNYEKHLNKRLLSWGKKLYEDYCNSSDRYDLKRLILPNPRDAESHCWNGYVHYARGVNHEAIESFDESIRLDPENICAHNGKGCALFKIEGPLYIRMYCDDISHSNDDDYNRRVDDINRSNMEYANNILASFDEFARLAPRNKVAHSNRAFALYNLKRYDEALKACNQALWIDSKYAYAHNNKAKVLYRLERYKEAHASVKKAIELGYKGRDAYETRAYILEHFDHVSRSVHIGSEKIGPLDMI